MDKRKIKIKGVIVNEDDQDWGSAGLDQYLEPKDQQDPSHD